MREYKASLHIRQIRQPTETVLRAVYITWAAVVTAIGHHKQIYSHAQPVIAAFLGLHVAEACLGLNTATNADADHVPAGAQQWAQCGRWTSAAAQGGPCMLDVMAKPSSPPPTSCSAPGGAAPTPALQVILLLWRRLEDQA